MSRRRPCSRSATWSPGSRPTAGPCAPSNEVSFDVRAGETLALVGESGSGKSVTAMSLMRLVRPPGASSSGRSASAAATCSACSEAEMRAVRGGGISMVFQDPMSSLNPVMRIRTQLEEAMLAHGKFTGAAARNRAVELMRRVGIPDPEARLADYPHAFSGGMRQRVMIAMALANQPDVIIADEPTTALDVTIQAQILELLGELNRDLGTAIVLITHNLGVVARSCQRVAVMYGGRIVEQAPVDELFAQPRHPYTRALLAATPHLAADRDVPLVPIEGRPPDLVAPIPGCAYAPRCDAAQERCHHEQPPTYDDGRGRTWECWVAGAGRRAAAARRCHRRAPRRARPDGGACPCSRSRTWSRPSRSSGAPACCAARRPRSAPSTASTSRSRRARPSGLVGESGCGKSTVARALLGIHPPTSGTIVVRRAATPATLTGEELRRFRSQVQLVFQDPMSSLNPRLTVGDAIGEPLLVHGLARGDGGRAAGGRAARARRPRPVGGLALPARVLRRPAAADRHRPRARRRTRGCWSATRRSPPSTCPSRRRSSTCSSDLQRELGLAYLFIGHDLATVRHISHRILVMYLGQVVESGPFGAAHGQPAAPLHRQPALRRARAGPASRGHPRADRADRRRAEPAQPAARVPVPHPLPDRAAGQPRPDRSARPTAPPLREVAPGQYAACHFPGELSGSGLGTSRPARPHSAAGEAS